jgi:hypothetical protein
MLLSLALGTRIELEPTEILLVVFCLYFVSILSLISYNASLISYRYKDRSIYH